MTEKRTNAQQFKRSWSRRGKNASISYGDNFVGLLLKTLKFQTFFYKTIYLQRRQDKFESSYSV